MSRIRSESLGDIYYQTGVGYPSHIAIKGSTYTDITTGHQYINKDGLVNWVMFLDGDTVITGGTSSGEYLPLSGGTVSGSTNFISGLTANTITATSYNNLPLDIRVTGGTHTNGVTTFVNNSGGTFNVSGYATTSCQYQSTLIASSSSIYGQSILGKDEFYFGNSKLGWNGPPDEIKIMTASPTVGLPLINLNCGIPLPMDLIENDKIKLCGIAYSDVAIDEDSFKIVMEVFGCDTFRAGSFDVLHLGSSSSIYRDNYCCFYFEYLVTSSDSLLACNNFLLVGFDSKHKIDPAEIRLTWSLNILRDCYK